jgi:hypothetical protein
LIRITLWRFDIRKEEVVPKKNKVDLCKNQKCQRGVGAYRNSSTKKAGSDCPDCGKEQYEYRVQNK